MDFAMYMPEMYRRKSLILFDDKFLMGNILPIISGRMDLAWRLGNIFPIPKAAEP
jgi:hypothetical protein